MTTPTSPQNSTFNPEEIALSHAGKGLRAHPLPPGEKQPPLIGYQDLATTDPSAVRELFQRRPGGNIAIATGPTADPNWHILVVDVDGAKGRESLVALERDHGPLTTTYSVTTGRADGGQHLYFRVSPAAELTVSVGKLGEGIDTRCEGGYVLAAGSIHPSGAVYTASGPLPRVSELAELPAWAIELLSRHQPEVAEPDPAPVRSIVIGTRAQRWAAGALTKVADELAATAEGKRNDTLNAAAYRLGRMVGGGLLDRSTVEAELLRAARTVGLPEDETRKTLRSGLEAGLALPCHGPSPRGGTPTDGRELASSGSQPDGEDDAAANGDEEIDAPLGPEPPPPGDNDAPTKTTVTPEAARAMLEALDTEARIEEVASALEALSIANAEAAPKQLAIERERALTALKRVKSVSAPARLVDLYLGDDEVADTSEVVNGGNESAAAKKRLVELARSLATLVHGPDDEPYALLKRDGHRETVRLRSGTADRWLRGLAYKTGGEVLGSQAVTDARETLAAIAIHDGELVDVHLRVAGDTERIEIDLGDDQWRSVQVTAEGWAVGPHAAVFRRSRTQGALPEPVKGGELTELRKLHPGLLDDSNWAFAGGWLVGALRPWGGYTVLDVMGPQGSAKSSLVRLLIELVDPSEVGLRRPPHDDRDLLAAASASRVLAFDNLSAIPQWLSDNLCTIATGGSLATRDLYTTADEFAVRVRAPITMTAIPDVVSAFGDLRDRAVVVRLPEIPKGSKLTDEEVTAAFAEAKPRLFGALLDALALGLRQLRSVALSETIRMIDHLTWAVACAPALGLEPDQIVNAHREDRGAGAAAVVEDSTVGGLIRTLVAKADWAGTASELLAKLADLATESQKRAKDWPGTPRAMRAMLDRLSPALKAEGISVETVLPTSGKTRLIHLKASRSSNNTTNATDTNAPKETDVSPGGSAVGGVSGVVPPPPVASAAQPPPSGAETLPNGAASFEEGIL